MASKDKLLESAQKFIDKGQFAKAIGEYQKLVDGFPKDFRYRQKLAELLSRERRNEEAQPHYEAVAKNFTETGFYLKAIAIYKQMQKVEPNRADLFLRLAELNEKQGLTGNALSEYRNLIAFYDKNKQTRDAVPVLQKMVTLDPENLGIRGKLIESLCSCHDDAAAREQFRSLVDFLLEKGEPAKIVKLYDKFTDLCPEAAADTLPLAQALVATDQANKALQLLKGLLKQDPENVEVLGLLIDCHLALGNHEDARLSCQHLIKSYPDNLLLRERYVRICLAADDRQRALAHLEEGRESFSRAGQQGLYETLLAEVQGRLPEQAHAKAGADEPPETQPETGADEPVVMDAVPAAPAETTPPAAAPEIATSRPATQPTPSRGLELELDLDLDLVAPVVVAPPAVPLHMAQAPPPVVIAAPQAEPPLTGLEDADQGLELDLELDFDLTGFAEESPAATGAQPPDQGEMELEVEMEGAEAEGPSPDLVVLQQEETILPETGLELGIDLEFAPEIGSEPVASADVAPESELELEFQPELEVASEPEPGSLQVLEAESETEVEVETEAEVESESEVEAEVESEVEAEADVEIEIANAEIEELEELEELEEVVEELEELEEVEELFEESGEASVSAAETGGESLAANLLPEANSAPSLVQLRAGLEEAEFYLRQGLLDDAERVVGDLTGDFAEHPEVVAKLAEIQAQRQAQTTTHETDAPFDLLSDINDDELLGGVDFDQTAEPVVDEFSLQAVNIEDEGEDDIQSHFDLGIAYKEMGLLGDAVAEFDRASRDQSRRLECLTLKGQCQIEMGQPAAAEGTYLQALEMPQLREEGRIVLCYELGLLYEILGRKQEALDNFRVVADIDLFFRDVTDKLKGLRQELGIDDQAIEAVSEGGSGRDRISFV